jgi:hypothetical protein
MSGNTEVVDVNGGTLRVADLQVGQRVSGFGSDLVAKTCEVIAIGNWGTGNVMGNYTW